MDSVGLRLSVQADTSQLTSGMNNVRQSFVEAGQSIDKAGQSLSSFVAAGANGRTDPFTEAQNQRRNDKFENFTDQTLLNLYGQRSGLLSDIDSRNSAIQALENRNALIRNEFAGRNLPSALKNELDRNSKWEQYYRNQNRNAEKELKTLPEISREDLLERAALRDGGGEIDADKFDGTLRETGEQIISELKRIDKNLQESQNNNGLPTDFNPETTPPESENEATKIMSFFRKGGVTGAVTGLLKNAIDTAVNVYVDESQIRNSKRSQFLGMVNGDVVSAENAAHQIDYLQKKENLDIGAGATVLAGAGAGAAIGSVVPGIGTAAGFIAGTVIGGAAALFEKTIGEKINQAKKAEEDSETQFMHGMSSVYQNTLPTYEQGVSVFYDRDNKSFDSDLELFRSSRRNLSDVFNKYSKDTGLSTADFGNYAIELAKQGIGNNDPIKVAEYTRRAAQWANYTGGDVGQFNSYLGMVARYGKEGNNSLDYAFGAAKASGLERAQFSEFLQGLESVISSGISKGFIRSTEDVSKTMATLSVLSNGSEFWKGEQGAERLNSINAGISNATSLSDTTQILAFQAFNKNGLALKGTEDTAAALTYIKGQDALNTFAAMERGIDGRSLKALTQTFDNAFGGDVMQNVMALKEISGLNITGAMQLYNMTHGGKTYTDKELDEKIKSMEKDPAYQSEKSIQQNMLNELQNMGEKMGAPYFRQELSVLNGYVRDIAVEVDKSKKGSFFYSDEYLRYGQAIETKKKEMLDSGSLDELTDNEIAAQLAYLAFMKEDELSREENSKQRKSPLNDLIYKGAGTLTESSGYTRAIETKRLRDIINEISESYKDDDTTNDKSFNSYNKSVESVLRELFGDVKTLLQEVAKNTKEVEVL